MGKIKKYKNGVEAFLSGEKGQRFFNFAYSIGAAVVIWGALFKILHLPMGNALLCIGMGTEVLMFVLTAFDRPPREYHWEEVFEVFNTKNPEDRPDFKGGNGGNGINGSIVIGGAPAANGEAAEGAPVVSGTPAGAAGGVVIGGGSGFAGTVVMGGEAPNLENATTVTQQYTDQMSAIADQMNQLRETTEALNRVSNVLLESYRAITDNSENINGSSTGYVEQMTSLNRNIAGLNTIYEIQLKSISSQLDNIDRVNRGLKEISNMYDQAAAQSDRYCEETMKMTRYMQQLNSVYEKMITAMTINMYRPMGGAMPMDEEPKATAEKTAAEEPETEEQN